MKDILLGAMAAMILGGAFLLGRVQQEAAAPAAPAAAAPSVAVRAPAEEAAYEAGPHALLSLYNPEGKLLRAFEPVGRVRKTAAGELVFATAEGKRVHTNATYVLELSAPPAEKTTKP